MIDDDDDVVVVVLVAASPTAVAGVVAEGSLRVTLEVEYETDDDEIDEDAS